MKMMTTTIANDIDGANGDDDSAPIPRIRSKNKNDN